MKRILSKRWKRVKILRKEVVSMTQYLHDIRELQKTVNDLIDLFYVDNYFKVCKCNECLNNPDMVLRSDAKSFIKYNRHTHLFQSQKKYYTTKEQYKYHLPKIKEWEKEIKKAHIK